MFLAQKAKQVYGVEIVPPAIDDARENALLNGIENAQFFVGKSEEILPKYYKDYEEQHGGEKAHADVIVVDSASERVRCQTAGYHFEDAAGEDCLCKRRFRNIGKRSENIVRRGTGRRKNRRV